MLLSALSFVGLGAIAVAPSLPLHPPSAALAQGLASHPFAGHSIVYVQTGDRWREAFITNISGRWSQGQTTWLYTVEYLDGSGDTEPGVTPFRQPTSRFQTAKTFLVLYLWSIVTWTRGQICGRG